MAVPFVLVPESTNVVLQPAVTPSGGRVVRVVPSAVTHSTANRMRVGLPSWLAPQASQ